MLQIEEVKEVNPVKKQWYIEVKHEKTGQWWKYKYNNGELRLFDSYGAVLKEAELLVHFTAMVENSGIRIRRYWSDEIVWEMVTYVKEGK